MSIPFPPERENDVTTLPFAGHCQRFTGALSYVAAAVVLFFERLVEAGFFGALAAVPVDAAGARGLLLLDLRAAVVVDAVFGGLVRRSLWPG